MTSPTVRTPAERRRRRERGSVSIFVVITALALLIAVGLVVDGSGKIRAIQKADATAGEAAREGGEAIRADTAIRGDGATPDYSAATTAARSYLTAADVTGTVTMAGATLHVDTTTTYQPVFLTFLGPMTVTGHADATLARTLNGDQR